MQLASNTRPKRDAEHGPREASPRRIVAMKDSVASANILLYMFAEDVVVEEITDIVVRIAIEVAARQQGQRQPQFLSLSD